MPKKSASTFGKSLTATPLLAMNMGIGKMLLLEDAFATKHYTNVPQNWQFKASICPKSFARLFFCVLII